MPACTKRIQLFSIPGGSTLEVGTQGTTGDYSTTVQIESDATPPGRVSIPNSTTSNKIRAIALPPAGNSTAVRFLTTFKSQAATTVTLTARIAGPNGPVMLNCSVTGKTGDPIDFRLLWLSS